MYNFILSSVLLFIIGTGLITGSLQAQQDSLAQYLADRADSLDNREALPFLEEAFQLCKHGGCADSTIARLYQRKSVAYYLDYIDDDMALRLADTAFFWFKKAYGKSHIKVANAKFNQGGMERSVGDPFKAQMQMDSAIIMCEALNRVRNTSYDSILVNWLIVSSIASGLSGDVNAAIIKGERARKNLHFAPSLAIDVNEALGNAYLEQGNYEKTKVYYERLQQLYPQTLLRASRINLGIAYLRLGEFEKAEQSFTRLITKSRANYLQSKSRGDLAALINDHANMAALELARRNLKLAKYYIERGYELLIQYEAKNISIYYPEFYWLRAQLAYYQVQYEDGLDWIRQALDAIAPDLEKSKNKQTPLIINGRLDDLLYILTWKIRIHLAQNQHAEALETIALTQYVVHQVRRAYQTSMSKYFILQRVIPVYEQGVQINLQLYTGTNDTKYLEAAYRLVADTKAILLSEGIQHEHAMQFSGLPDEVQVEEERLRAKVREQQRLLYSAYQQGHHMDSLRLITAEHEQAYGRFLKALERDYPNYYSLKYETEIPVNLTELQQKLVPEQALLEYFVGEDSLYTFTITSSSVQTYVNAIPADFTDSIRIFREFSANSIAEDCEQRFIGLSHYLYNILLDRPIADLSEATTRLVIIPDGLLNFISFEALLYEPVLQLSGSTGFVLERYACSYSYSSRLWLKELSGRRSAKHDFAGFGLEYDDHTLQYLSNIDYLKTEAIDTLALPLPCALGDTTRSLGKLVYSDDEVRNIAQMLGGDTWLNEAVVKPRFLEKAGDYRILHLAMHGSYDMEYPLNSSLIFTRQDSNDMFLRAAEVYGLELNSEMVVLSACNTAYGKLQAGEGPMTLARAFHYVGVPTVVASLWSIPDNSTSRIMELFYSKLQTGLPKDIALQEAKLAYISSDELSSPITRQPAHWASTIVIGDPVALYDNNAISYWWIIVFLLPLLIWWWKRYI